MNEKKKRLKFQNNTYLFIFIDKAIHANYLHNSRITISISLHPSIYPVTSPPILVQFNHVSLSHGIMIPISTLLDNEINSVFDLKLQIILRDSLTSRLIGKCYIPFNLNNDGNDDGTIKNFKYYKENDDEDLPFFLYQDSRFSIYSKNQQKEGKIQNKTEICQVILTIALGKESEKELIMPSSISCQEQIRFKRNFNQLFHSPPSAQISPRSLNAKANSPLSETNHNSTKLSDHSQKRKLNINNNITKLKPKSNNHIDIDTDTYKNRYKFTNINSSNNKNLIFSNKIKKNKLNVSENLTDDQVQFVISNWEKYALQNGWIPPPNTEKEKVISINEISPTRQKEKKPKFLGLLNRKLIPINQSNTTTNNINEEILIYNNKNGSEDIQFKDPIDTNDDENITSFKTQRPKITVDVNSPIVLSSSAPTSNKKRHRKKKNKSYFSQIQLFSPESKNDKENSKKFSSSSVVPQRTTQYQMINECKLDDDFQDKVQRCFNSDPPPKLQSIDEYESEKTSTDEIGLFETDVEYNKSVQSSPGLMNDSNERIMLVSASSGDEFFFQSDPTGSHISPLMAEKLNGTRVEDAEDDESAASERLFLSSPPLNNEDQNSKELLTNNEFETNKENKISNECQFLSDEQTSISESGKIDCKDENEIDTTKSSFETLEAMVKIPPIPKEPHSNYKVSHFDNLFDSTPTVSFGEKEIISVTLFRARPNPSEKLDTMYYSLKSSQKLKFTQKKDKIPPPLPLVLPSDSKTAIKRSPSLEKIFQDGYMDSGLNISGIYSDSSSE